MEDGTLPEVLNRLRPSASDPARAFRRIARYRRVRMRVARGLESAGVQSGCFVLFFVPVFAPGFVVALLLGRVSWGLLALLAGVFGLFAATMGLRNRVLQAIEARLIKNFIAGFCADELRAERRSPQELLLLLESAGAEGEVSELLPELCSGRFGLAARLGPFPSFESWLLACRSRPEALETLKRISVSTVRDHRQRLLKALTWVQTALVAGAGVLAVGLALLLLIGAPLHAVYVSLTRSF